MADDENDAKDDTKSDTGSDTDGGGENAPDERREGDGQHYVDRDKLDFDPDDGLLSGTALDGNSDIPGPHQDGEDDESSDDSSSEDSDDDGESSSGDSSSDDEGKDEDRPLPHPRED